MTTIRLYDESHIDLLNPRPEDIHILHVAISLSREGRYANQTRKFYSVAEHSYLVAAACWSFAHDVYEKDREEFRLLQLRALLHDASEAYLRDLPGPLKSTPLLAGYREIERNLQTAIFESVCLAPSHDEHDSYIHLIDKAIRTEEMDVLWSRNVESKSAFRFGCKGVPSGLALSHFMLAFSLIENPRKHGTWAPFRGVDQLGKYIR